MILSKNWSNTSCGAEIIVGGLLGISSGIRGSVKFKFVWVIDMKVFSNAISKIASSICKLFEKIAPKSSILNLKFDNVEL